MASVNFKLFKVLWGKVEEKFAIENGGPFTLENLNNIGVKLKQADWDKIARKLKLAEVSDINLSESTYKALYEYVGITQLTDLSAISEEVERSTNGSYFVAIGFLGRKNELNELDKFLLNTESRILEVYGLPMIGKTELISHFLDKNQAAKKYKSIIVKFGPQPEDAERTLRDVVFGNRNFNDFSGFSSNTLIVIQNFEEVLRWTGNPKQLHDIQDKYSNIKEFLKAVANLETIKLIIESRFQINFHSFLPQVRPLIQTLEIQGVEREEFWKFYHSKRFSRGEFENLCNKFNDHTWLLSLAYNNNDFIYKGDLIDALYRPQATTIYLWEYLQGIINRLEAHEVLSLCALTFLKEPIPLEGLYSHLVTDGVFHNRVNLDASLRSLEKKLLISVRREFYELNPYIREVCFTYLTETRPLEMQAIQRLPYFIAHGQKPIYNRIYQAQERGDYRSLTALAKEARKARRYNEAFQAIEAGLTINPEPEFILNEQAICYRETGQTDKAVETWEVLVNKYRHLPAFRQLAIYYRETNRIEEAIRVLEQARKINPDDVITLQVLAICYRETNRTEEAIQALEKAKKIDPADVKTLTELAIAYRENGEFKKSIETAQRAINLGDYHCYIVLANTYQRIGDITEAYRTAQRGVEASKGTDSLLIKKLQELESLSQQHKNLNRAKPLKIFISYSHHDEDIKERIDTFLATLKREGKIETWNDRIISAGNEWDNTIKTELQLSDIILLLISQDFIQSDYIWNIELPRALERHERGEAVVIPIFCRAIDEFSEMPFASLNGLPKNAIPINSPNNDDALSEVSKGIRKVVATLLAERGR